MGSLELGAYQAINKCLAIQPGERTILITDKETDAVAQALVAQITEASGLAPKLFYMEDLGRSSSSPAQLNDSVVSQLKESDVSIYASMPKDGEFKTFRRPYLDHVMQLPTVRHAHMISITEQIMSDGMSLDYDRIEHVTNRVLELAKKAKTMYVTTPAGTNLTINFSNKYRWEACDGKLTKPSDKKSHWTNLPDGEVFTTATDVNGLMVVDGVLGDYFDGKYGSLEKTPVHINIKDGRAVSVGCSNVALRDDFWQYLHTGKNSDLVGEVAIGTSVGLENLIGNLLQDEKFPGCHIAFGDPLGESTGADWTASTHVDGVMRKCTIRLDNTLIMRDGVFVDSILN